MHLAPCSSPPALPSVKHAPQTFLSKPAAALEVLVYAGEVLHRLDHLKAITTGKESTYVKNEDLIG